MLSLLGGHFREIPTPQSDVSGSCHSLAA